MLEDMFKGMSFDDFSFVMIFVIVGALVLFYTPVYFIGAYFNEEFKYSKFKVMNVFAWTSLILLTADILYDYKKFEIGKIVWDVCIFSTWLYSIVYILHMLHKFAKYSKKENNIKAYSKMLKVYNAKDILIFPRSLEGTCMNSFNWVSKPQLKGIIHLIELKCCYDDYRFESEVERIRNIKDIRIYNDSIYLIDESFYSNMQMAVIDFKEKSILYVSKGEKLINEDLKKYGEIYKKDASGAKKYILEYKSDKYIMFSEKNSSRDVKKHYLVLDAASIYSTKGFLYDNFFTISCTDDMCLIEICKEVHEKGVKFKTGIYRKEIEAKILLEFDYIHGTMSLFREGKFLGYNQNGTNMTEYLKIRGCKDADFINMCENVLSYGVKFKIDDSPEDKKFYKPQFSDRYINKSNSNEIREVYDKLNSLYCNDDIIYRKNYTDEECRCFVENLVCHRHEKILSEIDVNMKNRNFQGEFPVYYRDSDKYTEYVAFSIDGYDCDEAMPERLRANKKSHYNINAIVGIENITGHFERDANPVKRMMDIYKCVFFGKMLRIGNVSVKPKAYKNKLKKLDKYTDEQILQGWHILNSRKQKNLVDLCVAILQKGKGKIDRDLTFTASVNKYKRNLRIIMTIINSNIIVILCEKFPEEWVMSKWLLPALILVFVVISELYVHKKVKEKSRSMKSIYEYKKRI